MLIKIVQKRDYTKGDTKMSLQIRTNKGVVEGVSMNGYTVFKGIPYAKPPVGQLRWKAPEEMEPWDGVYKADHFARICPQEIAADPNPYYKEFYAYPEYDREQSEDCLYLNIWVPDCAQQNCDEERAEGVTEHTRGAKLPVAFYIHGGGFSGGYSSEIEFDGEGLTRRGVILVTIAYRLGVFGFLAHPWLSAESKGENGRRISGNYGILDQIMALNWVYDNIEAFGGDKDNITVYGQSAGCMSTQVLISSRLAQGRIAKAIFQSGLTCEEHFLATPTLAEEEAYGEDLVAYTGAASLEELRALDAGTLLQAYARFSQKMIEKLGMNGLVIVPCVDGYILDQAVTETYRDGNIPKIPYMEGSVTDDLGTTPEDHSKRVPGLLQRECERWARRQEEIGGRPSYVYWFDRTMPGDNKPAWHSLELWYTMGTVGRGWRPWEQHDFDLSREVMDCWTNFMKTGNPEGGNTAAWKPYTREKPFIRHFE